MSKVLTEIPCTVDWDNETLTLSLVNDLVNIITFYKMNPDEVFALDERNTYDKVVGDVCSDRVKDYLDQIGKSESKPETNNSPEINAGQLINILKNWPKETPIVVSVGNQFFDGESTWYDLIGCDEKTDTDNGPILLSIGPEPCMC